MNAPVPLLELRAISKSYGPVRALEDINFHVNRNEVVALLGDNGAGKSTLIKLISGVVRADSGEIRWDGQQVQVRNHKDSERLGIETIYQDAALVDTMSITRNVFMGREVTGPLGFMRQGVMRRITLNILEDLVEVGRLQSADRLVGELSGGQKQAVAIARAIYFKRTLLLLDEPTNALGVRATEVLLEYIRRFKREGVSCVLVTHNLYHAYQVCDRFVVVWRGRVVTNVQKSEVSLEHLTEQVVRT